MSNNSNYKGSSQQIYTIKTDLYSLGQKSSVLMKKTTPTSLTSSGKPKKKTVALTSGKSIAKLNKPEGVKKGTQGHTIFSVNPSRLNLWMFITQNNYN